MSNRHFPRLTEAQFKQLADIAEEHGGDGTLAGRQAAGSALLTMFDGDERLAERHLWGTWDFFVGGEPGKRPEAGVASDAAKFLNALVTVIVGDRNEVPAVPRRVGQVAA